MADNIEIKVQDKIAPTISTKLKAIASEARNADSAIKSLQAALNSIKGSALDQITRVTNTATRAMEQNATAAARLAKEQANAATAAQKLATEQQRTATATANAANAQDRAAASALRLENAQNKANSAFRTGASVVSDYIKTAIGIGLVAGAMGQVVNASDNYIRYNAILKNATTTHQELNTAQQETLRIANEAQTDVGTITKTYARFSNSLREFGATQKSVTNVTEIVSKALLVNGATAAETSSAMLQLSQAFGAGRLNGDEFRAMAESAPPLMRDLAASIGVPVGALKEMSKEGKLTTEVLLKAWDNPELLAKYREQAANITTMGGAWQRLKNELEVTLGVFEKATGIFASFAVSTAQLAKGIAIIRGFLFSDDITRLNEQLTAASNRLAILQKAAGISPELMKKAIDDVLRLTAALKELTKVNKEPGSLETKAIIDPKFYKELEKKLKKEQDAADRLREHQEANELKLSQLKREMHIEDEQDFLERNQKRAAESLKDAQREIEWMTEGEEGLAKYRIEQAKKVFDYKRKLEDELNGMAKKFEDMQDESQEKRIKKAQEEFERLNDQIARSLTDALMRGFEDGKSFAENFKDTLVNMFKTLILRPAIEYVIKESGVTGIASKIQSFMGGGEGSAQTAGGGNSLSNLNISDRLLSTVGTGISKLGTFFGSAGMASGGTNFSNGAAGMMTGASAGMGPTVAGSATGIGSQVGNWASNAGKFMSSYGGYISAGIQLLQGNVKGAAFTAAGAAIGSIVPGIGTLVGAAVGSMIGGLFGGKVKTQKFSSAVNATYSNGQFSSSSTNGTAGYGKALGAEGGLAGVLESYSQVIGSLMDSYGLGDNVNTGASMFQRSGKKTRAWGYFAANAGGGSAAFSSAQPFGSAQEAMTDLVNRILTEGVTTLIASSRLPEGIKMLFSGLSDQTEISKRITIAMALAGAQESLTEQYALTADTAARVSVATGLAGDQLTEFVTKLITTSNSLQTVGATILKSQGDILGKFTDITGSSSLPTTLEAFDNVLKTLDKTSTEGIQQFADLFQLRDLFASMTQTIDGLKTGVEGAIFAMSTPAEQMAIRQQKLKEAFEDLNLTVPGSMQELIDLGKSIDFTTEQGLTLAAVFPSLVQAFGETQQAAQSLIDTLVDPRMFRTLFEYERAQGLVSRYGADKANQLLPQALPSFDVGTNFVPNDMVAQIHQGERIIPAAENAALMQSSADVADAIDQMRKEQSAMLVSMTRSLASMERKIAKIDKQGVMIAEFGPSGNPTVIQVEEVNP